MTSRRLSILLAVVAASGLLAWYFLGREPHYRNAPPAAGRVWVAFGDSLTAGNGAGDGEDYPSQLGALLGVEILNAGVPGLTTDQGLARLEAVLELRPGVVLLCLGGNDSLQQIPLKETIANLAEIIDELQEAGAVVVLIGVRSATVLDEYHGPLKNLARDKQAIYIPNILQGVLGHRSRMSDDIHPSAAGYAAIAQRLAKPLRPLLPQD